MKICQCKFPKLKFDNDRKSMKTEQNVQKPWYNFKRYKIHAIAIAEGGKREERKVFDTIMSKNVPKFTTANKAQFEEVQMEQIQKAKQNSTKTEQIYT